MRVPLLKIKYSRVSKNAHDFLGGKPSIYQQNVAIVIVKNKKIIVLTLPWDEDLWDDELLDDDPEDNPVE